ncbi:ZIP family metal transporter [Candidatus Woesearchaeota archaeon]|nr:ZIP family metal transporter [Candidatus Woesearchaeota archaeon]
MINYIGYTFISVLIVSLISLVGVLTLSLKSATLKKCLIYLVSFSAGALLGDVFIHLLPKIVEKSGFGLGISVYILSGILFSFIVEKIINWRHCHHPTSKEHPHPFAIMNLIGDLLHNFLDGLIIGASYLASIPVGVATTIAVVLHEIPQEIGDFGILLHGGFSKSRALFLNFITALSAIFGAFVSLILVARVETSLMFLVPFAAGNFIYIAGADLIPELHKYQFTTKNSLLQLFAIILGIGIMTILLLLE